MKILMNSYFVDKLTEKKLKVTPQRIAVFRAVTELHNHPTAENVIDYIKLDYPNISVATVYKVLDSLVANNLLTKVKTDNGITRYDAVLSPHHHLHCGETDRIEDYKDEKLNEVINNYFKDNKIKNFEILDISVQITGKFNK
jgi:Fur family peroxide stress response transcriptional regulator